MTAEEPIYIVTGWPRSGTSMMMRALDKGGIPAAYNKEDKSHLALERDTGYLANPHGYYELGSGTEPWDFPSMHRGKAVKMSLASLPVMCPGAWYRVLIIRRDEAAVVKSLESYLGAMAQRGMDKPQLRQAWITHKCGKAAGTIEVAKQHLKNRRDVEHIIEITYESVLEAPQECFRGIVDQLGWPLDVEAASAVPEAKWNRSAM